MTGHEEIEFSTEINAPASVVYKVLLDFEKFPEWTSIMTISGEPKVGSELQVAVYMEDGHALHFKTNVTKVEENKVLRWYADLLLPLIFNGNHYFILEEKEDRCLLTHGEKLHGLLEPIVDTVLRPRVAPCYKGFNEDLKKRAESLAQN